MEFNPPALSPHVEDSISIYGCEYCPEIFTNNALLTLHMEVHKRRFVSHLFCKFCDRKFMHLKRLRNHEHVCPKAARDPPEADSGDTLVMDIHSDNVPTMEKPVAEVPVDDPPSPCIPEPDQNDPSEAQQGVARVGNTGGSQRVYNCSVCKRVYVTLSSLKRHENVHSWQRAYPCHYCNKVFALAEYRTKHEIWHTGERRYQCIFCLETFMTYYILKNHQKSFHGIDPRLAVKKKSASGGFKASVYPIKLYRLLPMKFRKKRYKTYSETYGDSVEGAVVENNSLVTPNEENSNPEPGSFNIPMTFMATTTTVAPVTPHINFKQPLEQDIDSETGRKRDNSKDVEQRNSHFLNHNNTDILQTETARVSCDDNTDVIMNMDHFSRKIPFLTKTLKTVNKLGELSAAAKRVEAMTKELLLSGTDGLKQGKAVGSRKTETYLAKPVCPGPSVDGDALPLCQITVKIGNEAIIRRKIKGSKLFPRKRKKSRQRNQLEGPGEWFSTEDSSGSARLHNQMAISAIKEVETYEEPNDHEATDQSWRPYYSYKAKKKKKKMRFKHRHDKQYVFPPTSVARAPANEDYPERRSLGTDDSTSANSLDTKRNIRNSSPRATYKCDICDSSFITESGLRAHVIGSHPCFCRTCGEQGPPGEVPAGGDYVCNNCMESGSCFDNTPQRSSTEKKYRCSFCPQRFLYLATKRSHERKHQEVGKGYKYDKCPPRSKHATCMAEDSPQHTIKSEEEDEEVTPLKSKEEGTGTSIGNIVPKMEATADFSSIAPKSFQEPHSKTKDLLSASNSDSVFPVLLPTKVKHKIAHPFSKKRMDVQDCLHLPSKKQASERDSGRGLLKRPKTNSHEKYRHPLWKYEYVK
ncbi:Zinc finger and BTB domain-containing protein 38 [Merluccius polli]|uniref:Zinc finger and BTB domain-containing protein 38 n=1 Tax=Merluccius polli TaxID=89951 RepID=A0AA47NU71_MERPO|nr:Zinc finger and BTB domain-containing protein 38 [Merluccius polli]